MTETPRPRTGEEPVEIGLRLRRRARFPPGRVADGLEHPDQPLFGGMVDAELDRIGACERRRLTDRQLSREILLELSRRAHAVIAQPGGERRSLLADLERAVAEFRQLGDAPVDPWIGKPFAVVAVMLAGGACGSGAGIVGRPAITAPIGRSS